MNIVQPIRDKEDIERMKKALRRKKRDLVLFIFGINCGLRISDILKLNVEDVKGKDFLRSGKIKRIKIKGFRLIRSLKLCLKILWMTVNPMNRYL